MQRIFLLILGQYSPSVRDQFESNATWKTINANSDVVVLLKLICKSLYQRATKKKTFGTSIDAANALFGFHQPKRTINIEYCNKTVRLVDIYEHLDGELFASNT